jgi:hypothetical protein
MPSLRATTAASNTIRGSEEEAKDGKRMVEVGEGAGVGSGGCTVGVDGPTRWRGGCVGGRGGVDIGRRYRSLRALFKVFNRMDLRGKRMRTLPIDEGCLFGGTSNRVFLCPCCHYLYLWVRYPHARRHIAKRECRVWRPC